MYSFELIPAGSAEGPAMSLAQAGLRAANSPRLQPSYSMHSCGCHRSQCAREGGKLAASAIREVQMLGCSKQLPQPGNGRS